MNNRRERLFDRRNLKVVRVHEDPLGRVLGDIARFHRCQVSNLLTAQLTPEVKDRTEWIKNKRLPVNKVYYFLSIICTFITCRLNH